MVFWDFVVWVLGRNYIYIEYILKCYTDMGLIKSLNGYLKKETLLLVKKTIIKNINSGYLQIGQEKNIG